MDLKDKVVFLTGGAQGIGKACAQMLLAKGAKVFLVDKATELGTATVKELQGRFGEGNVKFESLDITDLKKFGEVFHRAVQDFGQVDIMVNNAGLVRELDWQLTINVNVVALIHGTKLAIEHMRKDKGGSGGRIVNVSSKAGVMDYPVIPTYAATKHAARAFTSSLALSPDREKTGIEYAVLCPGFTETECVYGLLQDGSAPSREFIDQQRPRLGQTAERVAEAMLVLLQLRQMNGALLLVEPEKPLRYLALEFKDVDTKPE